MHSKKLAKTGYNKADLNRIAKEINIKHEAEAILKALEDSGFI